MYESRCGCWLGKNTCTLALAAKRLYSREAVVARRYVDDARFFLCMIAENHDAHAE